MAPMRVDEFPCRSLRVLSDKLPATADSAAVINDGTVGEYLAGILNKNMVFGLAYSTSNRPLSPTPVYRAPT